MRRADRLFQIVQLLRRRKIVTAAYLAGELEVSERTIYRDLRDLTSAGTPIEGEAGVGYRLRAGFDLPPLMFNREEIEALVLGARIVASFGDTRLARASRSVLDKVEAILPKDLKSAINHTALFAPNLQAGARISNVLGDVRSAIAERAKIAIEYEREDGQHSRRVLWPLAAFFWGKVWTLVAWCELRGTFRSFRLDRIESLEVLPERFTQEPGRTLRDYLASIDQDALKLLER